MDVSTRLVNEMNDGGETCTRAPEGELCKCGIRTESTVDLDVDEDEEFISRIVKSRSTRIPNGNMIRLALEIRAMEVLR